MVKKLAVVLSVLFLWVTPTLAADTASTTLPTSNVYTWVKVKEFVRLNVITFKKASKIKVLESFSATRIAELQAAVTRSDNEAIDPALTRYSNQKTKALQLAQKLSDEALLNQVRERTLEQQRTMTELQVALEGQGDVQQNIVRTQKEVADQVINTVRVVVGEAGANEVVESTKEVWYAPGTSGVAPPAGWTYEGGAKNTYAPGTSAGGTGGTVIEGGSQYAPGTTSGGTSSNTTSNTVIEGNAGSNTSGGNANSNASGGGQTVVGD
jgi:hypothetical protein